MTHRTAIQNMKKPETRPVAHPQSALMNPLDAAAYLDVSQWTLAEWRCTGYGPRFVKLGNLVRYSKAEIDRWIESNLTNLTTPKKKRGKVKP